MASKLSATDDTRRLLFEAARGDDVERIKSICKEVVKADQKLSDNDLRDTATGYTVLHQAVVEGCWNVVDYLISSTRDLLLLTDTLKTPSDGRPRLLISLSAVLCVIYYVC